MQQSGQLLEILKKYWGYDDFRPVQSEVIRCVLSGRDALALMPTGAGKSLLYQLPALSRPGLCIVVTPLIALMKDQVDRLRKLGIAAAAIHSGLTRRQIDLTLDNASWGDLKLLYIAPERIASPAFRERVVKMNVNLLAVDEAHCISQWGYDFRPSYLRIAQIRQLIPDVPLLALTASATPPVTEDIMRLLLMEEGRLIRSSFARANLSFAVRHTDDKQEQLLRIAANVPGCGVVYTRTRDQTEKLARWLCENGVEASAYHAGMTYLERNRRQESWTKGESRIMVATNAFGMGIDKADVRFVVHYDICDSPEAYYQEAGRAGRDGGRSFAVLLAASDDRARAAKRFATGFPPIEKIRECYELLFNYLQIGIGDGKFATFAFNVHEFAAFARMYTATVLNALKILQQNGYLTLTDEADNPPRITFEVTRDDLYKIRIDREELDHILRVILRLYEGLFGDRLIAIDENEIAQAAGYTTEKVHELLKKLWRLHVIKYVPGSRSPLLMLNEERLPPGDLYISPESYRIRKEMAEGRIEAMFAYADNSTVCRSKMLQEYFGVEDVADCGVCDICLAAKKRGGRGSAGSTEIGESQPLTIERQIMLMVESRPRSVKEIVCSFRTTPDEVIRAVEYLCARGTHTVGDDGKLRPLPRER